MLTKRIQVDGDQVTQNSKQYWACKSATLSIACVGAEFTIKAINSLADERASYFSVIYTTLAHAGRPSIVLERSDDHSGRSCRPQCRTCADETVDAPSRTHQQLIYGPYHDFSQLPSSSGRGAPSSTIWSTRDRFRQNMHLRFQAHPIVPSLDVVEPTVQGIKDASMSLGRPLVLKGKTLAYDRRGNFLLRNQSISAGLPQPPTSAIHLSV